MNGAERCGQDWRLQWHSSNRVVHLRRRFEIAHLLQLLLWRETISQTTLERRPILIYLSGSSRHSMFQISFSALLQSPLKCNIHGYLGLWRHINCPTHYRNQNVSFRRKAVGLYQSMFQWRNEAFFQVRWEWNLHVTMAKAIVTAKKKTIPLHKRWCTKFARNWPLLGTERSV